MCVKIEKGVHYMCAYAQARAIREEEEEIGTYRPVHVQAHILWTNRRSHAHT